MTTSLEDYHRYKILGLGKESNLLEIQLTAALYDVYYSRIKFTDILTSDELKILEKKNLLSDLYEFAEALGKKARPFIKNNELIIRDFYENKEAFAIKDVNINKMEDIGKSVLNSEKFQPLKEHFDSKDLKDKLLAMIPCMIANIDSLGSSYPVKKTIKERILKRENALLTTIPEKPTSIEAFLHGVYMDKNVPLYIKKEFEQNVKESYNSPYVKPIIDLAALCVLGKHNEVKNEKSNNEDTNSNKKYKVISAKGNLVGEIEEEKGFNNPFNQNHGTYSGKNTSYTTIFDKLSPIAKMFGGNNFGLILHETSHFAMNKVFKDKSNPYFMHDKKIQTEFENVIKITKERLDKKKIGSFSMREEFGLHNIIKDTFNSNEVDQASELIVRIPHVIGFAGPKKGEKFLQDNYPELINFYEKRIIPPMQDFLEKHKYDKHLDLDRGAKEAKHTVTAENNIKGR